jgi:FkbM family methyltransferase
VGIAARFSMRLYSLQTFLSWDELKAKRRAQLWRQFTAMLERPSVARVEIADGRVTFFYRDGCAFHASPFKLSVSSTQYSHGDFEPAETRLMTGVVQSGWTVVDVGANFGWHAIHLARHVGSAGRVFAFEPIPETFDELFENRRLNNCEHNLEIVNAALGTMEGDVTFYLPSIHLGAGAASQHLDLGAKVQVRMHSLDDFLEQRGVTRVDFIKADVEGGELNVLRGAERIIGRCRPAILVENVDVHCRRFGQSPSDLMTFLRTHGYRGLYIGENGQLVPFDEGMPPNGNFFFTSA